MQKMYKYRLEMSNLFPERQDFDTIDNISAQLIFILLLRVEKLPRNWLGGPGSSGLWADAGDHYRVPKRSLATMQEEA